MSRDPVGEFFVIILTAESLAATLCGHEPSSVLALLGALSIYCLARYRGVRL